MAPLVFGFYVASAGGGIAIDSVTASEILDNSGSNNVTVTSIPAGALVLALVQTDYQGTGNTSVVTSANLTWTQRPAISVGTNFHAAIHTAVAGSALSNEVISTALSGGRGTGICVVVLTGANTTALTNHTTTNASTTAFSISLTCVGSNSLVIATFSGVTFSSTTDTGTPDAGTTEMSDKGNTSRFNTHWTGRNTTAGGGTQTVSGVWGTANMPWAAAAIEIQSA